MCPKESPEKAHEHELSDKNQLALLYYFEVKGSPGACPMDPIVRQNNTIIEMLFTASQHESMRAFGEALPLMIARGQ